MRSVIDRLVSARVRMTFAEDARVRISLRISESRRRLLWSRAALDRPHRAFGGASSSPDRSDAAILARLQMLIESGRLPDRPPSRTFAGRSTDHHQCAACDLALRPGEVEFEVVDSRGGSAFMHLHCLDLWRQIGRRPA
jgi:hypothetical protein